MAVGRKPETVNLTFYKEPYSLEQPPPPTTPPPKRGDETLEGKPLASWFPLWGERWCKHQKGHAKRKKDNVGIAEKATNLSILRTLRNLSNLSVTVGWQ